MKDFLLEHYKVVNERLTQSDRNRDVWVGAYLVLMVGSLGFAFYPSLTSSNSISSISLQFSVLGFLFVLGIFVAIYVAIARGWHCEFSHAAIGISKTFFDEELDLLKAARKFKQSSEFTSYFNVRGTEFWVFMLVLSCLAFELFLFLQIWSYTLLRPLWWRVSFCALPFLFGIPLYWWYLKKRASQFPEQCYYSIPRRPGASPLQSTLNKQSE